ncbi:hypothetical protein INT45_000618 [Circinella minor]|uniref:Uncharacterized protein n=1 Tax=Circinella minor TaxID=1195481 RepID=A0A8H7SBI3_9FUNG|nr:hypothetical protein INT45_000618 [Circinella minor]
MVVNSKVLLCAALTTFVYHLAGAVPLTAGDGITPKPILHLDEKQIQEFKHTNPDQSEPDIVFPKNAGGLYAAEEHTSTDTEVEETEIESNHPSSDQMDDDDDDDDTMEDAVFADEEEYENEEDSQIYEGSQEEEEEEEEVEELEEEEVEDNDEE